MKTKCLNGHSTCQVLSVTYSQLLYSQVTKHTHKHCFHCEQKSTLSHVVQTVLPLSTPKCMLPSVNMYANNLINYHTDRVQCSNV